LKFSTLANLVLLIVEEVDVDELFVVLDEIVEEVEGFEDDEEEEEEDPSLLQPTNVRERSKGKSIMTFFFILIITSYIIIFIVFLVLSPK